ncbi:hypothetical protein KTS45_09335 [Halomicroarcula limicola]|uniref:Uncharacterized protein n=1 Tax=Haloarcula limicola TaxID=1429915 RepID=A0A8J8C4P8_9EURY|nr:hypothetical protein [Halomicroarcula limicola]MBV0924404.1 hypothetical protein [Halomicroarcula limicola]
MSTALPAWLPDRAALLGELSTAAAVGATLYVFDGSLPYAAGVAVAFFALRLLTDLAEAAVGDYADHALFGVLVLAATGYLAVLTPPSWLLAVGGVVGGWFLLDGVQHLRHGVARDEVGIKYSHEGSILTGLPKALLVRLAEPFLL